MTTAPPPGSFGLARIGISPDGEELTLLGQFVAAGQAIIGDGSRYTHAFLVLDDGTVIEGQPGGAVITPLAHYLGRRDVVFCDAPVRNAVREVYGANVYATGLDRHYEGWLRAQIVRAARPLEGTPYSFLDYLALALAHFGIRPKRLRKYLATSKHLICSQLVDEVYRRSGIHLFNDGRLSADVTPGDLDDYRVRNLEGDQP